MSSNNRVMRTRCLFWSRTPSIQESCSQRVMTGIASCGTWPEEWRSARTSTWWDCWPPRASLILQSLRLIASHPLCSLWLYSHWSWKWPDPDICPLSHVTQMSCFHAQWNEQKRNKPALLLIFFPSFGLCFFPTTHAFPFLSRLSIFVSHSFPLSRHCSSPLITFTLALCCSLLPHAWIFPVIKGTTVCGRGHESRIEWNHDTTLKCICHCTYSPSVLIIVATVLFPACVSMVTKDGFNHIVRTSESLIRPKSLRRS